jgi:phosphocarrier protein
MIEKTVRIVNKLGLHARPAALLVKVAGKFKSEIKLTKDDLEINAKSIMGVMMLAAEYESEVKITAEGEDEEQAVNAIEELINSKFNEE